MIWRETYQPLLGRKLQGLAFLSLAGSDTPDVIASAYAGLASYPVPIGPPAGQVSYSGAAGLMFDEAEIVYITWEQVIQTTEFCLIPYRAEHEQWARGALDRVWAPWDGCWEAVLGKNLIKVRLFRSRDAEHREVTAVAHDFEGSAGHSLWVCNASGELITPGDDLIVLLRIEPEVDGLELIEEIACQPA